MLQTNIKDPWTCKPVYIASKKKVQTAYTPNSYRIFQDEINDRTRPRTTQIIKFDVKQTSNEPEDGYFGKFKDILENRPGYIENHPREPSRRNCPHPDSARFLRSNAHQLNEPIPFITTDNMEDPANNDKWWKHSEEPYKLNIAPATSLEPINIIRQQRRRSLTAFPKIERTFGHKQAENPWILNHREANEGLKNTVEHISYRHGYNSRTMAGEPARGKLHGSFVWTGDNNKNKVKMEKNVLKCNVFVENGKNIVKSGQRKNKHLDRQKNCDKMAGDM
jgi:hypothetical protein